MPSLIQHPVILSGEMVDLIPLVPAHFEALDRLSGDPRIWEFYSFDGSRPGKIIDVLTKALIERDKSLQYPFTIVHKPTQTIIGSTRFLEVQPEHRKLEIGGTWLHPAYWATAINIECKLLLLTYCFEQLKTARVQLKTDVKNTRSRKAIEKIGGQYEGCFHNDMVREDGSNRDSLYFSIVDRDWASLRPTLTALYLAKKQG